MKYAHSKLDPITRELLPEQYWHSLPEHLHKTAKLAAEHAGYFGCATIGEIMGYNHDYGKNSPDFLKRLYGDKQRVDHKTVGALIVDQHYPKPMGLIMAYIIYGHHGGLPNHISFGNIPGLDEVLRENKFSIINDQLPVLPELLPADVPGLTGGSNPGLTISLWIRMLFSSLVDADYLDAEGHFQPEKTAKRGQYPSIKELQQRFQPFLKELLNKSQEKKVFQARRSVLEDCLKAAPGPKGFYTLTAPTGSGKTLASLAFALKHAAENEMRRIIIALPFISIIEQTADEYRRVLGKDAVLEHHSNLVFHEDGESELNPAQLASENWDASVIVTTNVQLFESLFSSKPSKARKLHRLAGSVIILDEAQSLPSELLRPTLAALQCLCADYGVTVLFCTATQPSIKPKWLDHTKVTEIITDPTELYSQLKRVNVFNIGGKSDHELVKLISTHQRVLCIVNSRRQAQSLYKLIPNKTGVFHLSALMCPKHRSKKLKMIKEKEEGERCIVIATNLIEAGVDLDFPVVYREMAGIESINQAAGRCNREGELKDKQGHPTRGHVYLFESADYPASHTWFSDKTNLARQVMMKYPDPLEPDAVQFYFDLFFHIENKALDKYKILDSLNKGAGECSFQFREISAKYRFVHKKTISVIIPYDSYCINLLKKAQQSSFPASFSRELQPYAISLYPKDIKRLQQKGRLSSISDTLYYLNSSKEISTSVGDLYDEETGLIILDYGITLHVTGPYALFTRPEMKGERVSYDVITPSAARGVLEAILWKPAMKWVIDRITVLNPIEFESIRRNEVGSKMSPRNIAKAMSGADVDLHQYPSTDRQQRASLVLRNVAYLIEAHFQMNPAKAGPTDTPEKFYNMFLRRARLGQCFHTPYLGCREFAASFQLIEEHQAPPVSSYAATEELDLGWMLWDLEYGEKQAKNKSLYTFQPRFFRSVMRHGVIKVSSGVEL